MNRNNALMAPERGLPEQIENIEARLAHLERGQRRLSEEIGSLRSEITGRIDSQTQRWTAALGEFEQSLRASIGADISATSQRLMVRIQQNEENIQRLETKIDDITQKIGQLLDHVAPARPSGPDV